MASWDFISPLVLSSLSPSNVFPFTSWARGLVDKRTSLTRWPPLWARSMLTDKSSFIFIFCSDLKHFGTSKTYARRQPTPKQTIKMPIGFNRTLTAAMLAFTDQPTELAAASLHGKYLRIQTVNYAWGIPRWRVNVLSEMTDTTLNNFFYLSLHVNYKVLFYFLRKYLSWD